MTLGCAPKRISKFAPIALRLPTPNNIAAKDESVFSGSFPRRTEKNSTVGDNTYSMCLDCGQSEFNTKCKS